MNKKILITGTNGLLGQKIVYALLSRNKQKHDVEIIATSKGENRIIEKNAYIYESLDITDKNEVEQIIEKHRPDTVINTAAMTNVDGCETEKELCRNLNVDAVNYLCKAMGKYRLPNGKKPHLIHLSTDFVFDGENGPYSEGDKPNPLSYYAQSKLDSETVVQNSSIPWSIIRTIIVFGIVDNMSRSNVVLWAKSALEKGQPINVVDDQFRAPTLAEDLAEGCISAALKGAEGIFHVSGKETMSIIELVRKVADFYGLDKTIIHPIKSEMLNQAAKRPPVTGFIIDKAIRELDYHPHSFEEGLRILDERLRNKS